jgi:hypothetical protein
MSEAARDPVVMEDAASQTHVLRRRRAGLLVHALAVAGLIPAFVLLAPASRWDQPLLLATLLALAVAADRAEVPLPSTIRLDATIALALISVVLLGPLPALLVALLPTAVNALEGRERLLRAGNLANLAAYGWELVAVSALLAATVPPPLDAAAALPWLLAAGPVLLLVNWAVGPLVFGTLWLGHAPRTLVRLLADVVPASSVMLVLAAVTAALSDQLGPLALALFAAIAIVPQSALTYVARSRPVARLDRVTATQRYAHALALHLGLKRGERRHLARVVALAAERAGDSDDPLAYMRATLRDTSRASIEAGHVSEWWNGGGGPAGLRGAVTPLSARIVAVADTWSALTARDTPELSHTEALAELGAAGGTRLDPHVVLAAHAVVAEERVSASEPAPEPSLHRFGVPARLRAALAAA